jgi:hypothetical protein
MLRNSNPKISSALFTMDDINILPVKQQEN